MDKKRFADWIFFLKNVIKENYIIITLKNL